MSRVGLIHSDIIRRCTVKRHDWYSKCITSIYNEHAIFSSSMPSRSLDAIHEPFFHGSFYLSLKRRKISTYKSKVRNRCFYTGSARAVFSEFKLSRMAFKKLARHGSLNGVTKSS